jgi:hypothetical protein
VSLYDLSLFFLFYFNLLWYVTYALVLRRGYLDKMAGIPLISLTLNLAWDFTGAFIMPSPSVQMILNSSFLLINALITLQWFRYWRNDFKQLSALEFYFFWAFAQVASFVFIIRGSVELNDVILSKVGFIDNFINSALFIPMLYRRPALEGQSIYIGLSKLIGTGSSSLAFTFAPFPGPLADSIIMNPLMIGIFILDIVYVVLYYVKARRLGINPWRRW